MPIKTKSFITLLIATLTVQGCAAPVGLTMLGIGGGTAAGAGVEHTMNGITYKTFTAPVEQVHAATRQALAQMAIAIDQDTKTDSGRTMVCKAADREIDIEFEALTPRTTRMRVVANQGLIFKDSATSTEIILQTADTLQSKVVLAAGHH